MPKIFIWGASGHAKVVAEIVRLTGRCEIAGFVDDTPSAAATFLGLPVFHHMHELPAASAADPVLAVVAVGDCRARMRIAQKLEEHGLKLSSAVHPQAVVSAGASLGDGTVVMAGAVVNPGAVLGTNVIVNTGATIDHDCSIADGVHVGPGAHLGGWVTVGRGTWLGIGAIVRDRVTIGKGAVIGAGAVVVCDIPDHVMALGVPAKPVKEMPS
ncbi:MAG: acetyltransferase [Acidobacteriota bacterium]|nr:acetyltransferase [Acidobacteriota bacterium]